jgi:hypothetical protein
MNIRPKKERQMIRHIVLILSLACSVGYCPAGSRDYGSNTQPEIALSLPEKFKDYQLLPGSLSPDRKFGIILPKRDVLFERFADGTARFVLATVSPFSEISDIPRGYSNLTGNACYTIHWSRDSTAFLFEQGIKWGADRVYLGEISGQRRLTLTDLAAKVTELVKPEFKASGLRPYNDTVDFIFDAEDRFSTSDTGGWSFTPEGNVAVDCTCTTDPKFSGPGAWTIVWKGVWKRDEKRFIHQKVERRKQETE